MNLLQQIKNRSPEYLLIFSDIINKFTVLQGGARGTASKSATWAEGKFFSNKYEIYLYAIFLGLKHDNPYKRKKDTKSQKFREMKYWQYEDLVNFMIMSVLGKSSINFLDLEKLEENELEKEITNIKKLIEEYANGGLEIIKSKYDEDENYFYNNENCFLDLLDSR